MSDVVAVIGLLAVVEIVGLFALALVVHRQNQKIRELARVVVALSEKRTEETGERVEIDTSLLDAEPADVVAAGEDLYSHARPPAPWVVR